MRLSLSGREKVGVLLSALLLLVQLHWCGEVFRTVSGEACTAGLAFHTAEHSGHKAELHGPNEACHKGCQASFCAGHSAVNFAATLGQQQADVDLLLVRGLDSAIATNQFKAPPRLYHLYGSPPHGPPPSINPRGPPAFLFCA